MFKPISAIINFSRAAFRALLLLFILSNSSPVLAPFGVETEARGAELERDDDLQAESDVLLPLFDAMPPVPVYLKDEPMLKTGTNTETGAAYTHCYGQELPAIYVKKIFYQKANRKQLVNLLKHEMTHAWLCRQRLMSGHDENFRRKFKQIGGFGN
jgi:hypothetical protein